MSYAERSKNRAYNLLKKGRMDKPINLANVCKTGASNAPFYVSYLTLPTV